MALNNDWKKRSGTVYSTNPAFDYNKTRDDKAGTLPNAKQNLRVYIDRSHRKGKEVTLVKNFVGNTADAKALCKNIKVHCGAGGSLKDGEIIIQGDQRRKVLAFLAKEGYRVKG